jgi:hypothetical protein
MLEKTTHITVSHNVSLEHTIKLFMMAFIFMNSAIPNAFFVLATRGQLTAEFQRYFSFIRSSFSMIAF